MRIILRIRENLRFFRLNAALQRKVLAVDIPGP
jgi:hypothetical protein